MFRKGNQNIFVQFFRITLTINKSLYSLYKAHIHTITVIWKRDSVPKYVLFITRVKLRHCLCDLGNYELPSCITL